LALTPIDWQVPWLAPLADSGRRLEAAVAAGLSVAEALNCAAAGIELDAGPLRFVSQATLPAGEAFEAYIARTAQVPTREHLHDFFSGLVWLHHPLLKRRLNQLQAAEIERHGVGPRRGTLRDALTRFDEHGALLSAPPTLWQALRDRDWQALFVERRVLWQQARLQIVGHALLEQLATAPRKPLTAFVWAADDRAAPGAGPASQGCRGPATAAVESWAGQPFLPLPVLGVPGWWLANQQPSFYADSGVFRPPKALPVAGVVVRAGLNTLPTP